MVLLGAATLLRPSTARGGESKFRPRPAAGGPLGNHRPEGQSRPHQDRVNKNGQAWGDGLTEKAVWHVVREYARKTDIERLAPHDFTRTCARLCHAAGGELEQFSSSSGHVSIQTTERYLGCKQRIRSAVNDR